MAWSDGTPLYLPSWSYSCRGVTSAYFYAPMEANVSVNEASRTYTITVNLYMSIRRNINVYMNFNNVTIDGHNFGTKVLSGTNANGNVLMASRTYSGSYNSDGTPNRAYWSFGGSYQFNPWVDAYCSVAGGVKTVSNSIGITVPNISPSYTPPAKPTIDRLVNITDTTLTLVVSVSDFGIGGNNKLYAEARLVGGSQTVISTNYSTTSPSGELIITGLSRGEGYYIYPAASNNGGKTYGNSRFVITGCTSAIRSASSDDPHAAAVSVIVYGGSRIGNSRTTLQMSTDGTKWVDKATLSTTPIQDFVIDGLEPNTKYYFRARTITTGTNVNNFLYDSPAVSVVTPSALTGTILGITAATTDATLKVTANSTDCEDITATVYYRISGVNDAFAEGPSKEFKSGEEVEIVVNGLLANFIAYDIYVVFKDCADNTYTTNTEVFYTEFEEIDNHNCESLKYMLDLICQSLNAIKTGNITVYANDDTKKWCEDEDDDTPTMASILSRINRFMGAVTCILCQIMQFTQFKDSGKEGQIFMAEVGWSDLGGSIDNEGASSMKIASSGSAYSYINQSLQTVWHKLQGGTYPYFAKSIEEMNEQTPDRVSTRCIVGSVYYMSVYSGGTYAWDTSRSYRIPFLVDFSVLHVSRGLYENDSFYWFGDTWNRLDYDPTPIKDWNKEWMAKPYIPSIEGKPGYNIYVAKESVSNNTLSSVIPTDSTRETIIFVTEENS